MKRYKVPKRQTYKTKSNKYYYGNTKDSSEFLKFKKKVYKYRTCFINGKKLLGINAKSKNISRRYGGMINQKALKKKY